MSEESQPRSNAGNISRADFLKRSGAAVGGIVLGGGLVSEPAWARAINHEARDASAGTIKIGYVSPLTGGDSGFGEPDPYVISLAKKAFQGFKIAGKTYNVQIIAKDAQSSPSVAAQVTQQLINGDQVDLILAASTPEVIVPAADACEAAGVPCISTTAPWEAWWLGLGGKLNATGGAASPGFKSVFHFSFGVPNFYDTYTDMWKRIPTNKKVGVLYPNDADGNAIRGSLAPLLKLAGYTIVDPGPYQDGTTDFTSQITKFKSEQCEIFNTFPLPPDFVTFWQQAEQQGYTKMVKIAQIAKTGLFESQIQAIGLTSGNKLATAAYWAPSWPGGSSLTGISNTQLGAGYEAHSGKYWNQQTGASLALFDVAAAALKASGNPNSRSAITAALKKVNVKTPLGTIDFAGKDPKRNPVPGVVATPILGCQWLRTKGGKSPFGLSFVEHEDYPAVPIQAKLVPYN